MSSESLFSSGPIPEETMGTAGELLEDTPVGPLRVEPEYLENYAREQFAQIRSARQQLEADKAAAEQALAQRRQELERQSKALVSRLQELHEREQRLAEELEQALPDLDLPCPPAALDEKAALDTLEVVALRRRVREQELSLELLGAERDTAWSQLRQYREQQQQQDELDGEHASVQQKPSGAVVSDAALQDLRQLVQVQEKLLKELQAERDRALSTAQELHARLKQLDQVKSERDAALQQLRLVTEKAKTPEDDESAWVDLDAPHNEVEVLRQQVRAQHAKISELRGERDDAWNYLQQLPEEHQRQLEQVESERDAALAQLRQFAQEPDNFAQQEAEFAGLRLQLREQERLVADQTRELQRRETEMHKRLERSEQELTEEQQRLQQLSVELAELDQQLREDRDQLEVKEREIRLKDAQLHLREAEVRELMEITELNTARGRTELNQERLKLARQREAFRMEREAFEAERERRNQAPLPKEN